MKVSQIRVATQVVLHVALIGHVVAYYAYDWRAVGALDFQSFFHHFFGEGLLTAGALLAGIVYASALVLGRVFCSWGCHFGATQDFAAWVLRRIGWRAPVVTTRFLHWFPVAFLLVIFLLPIFENRSHRVWELRADFAAIGPWDTLPGWFLSIATFFVCGLGALLFLGTRGFCRFVCPYGALFRVTDKLAPFKVRRVKSCGGPDGLSCTPTEGGVGQLAVAPCTAACPTAIDVHRETSDAGVVTGVDCVRCHLCIEACPQGALAYRARSPAARPDAGLGDARVPCAEPSLPFWGEALVAIVAAATYWVVDLVYGGHFLAAVLGLAHGFFVFTLATAFRSGSSPTVLGLPLRSGRSWTFVGVTLVGLLFLSWVALFRAGAFKWLYHSGLSVDPGVASVSSPLEGLDRTLPMTPMERARLEQAAASYRHAVELFPHHAQATRLLLSAYLRLHDQRAVALAERVYLSMAKEDRGSRETLRKIYLRFGRMRESQLLPSKDAE